MVVLPKLPYALDALEPQISRETMEFHYGKHLQAYVDKLNELIVGTDFANMTLDQIIDKAQAGPLFNNAAQAWNHAFYFLALTPAPNKPEGSLKAAIDKAFGGLENLKEAFVKAGVGQFGSGWVWLTEDMKIVATSNALRPDARPIMVLDVWEHAYYIDYRNRRQAHLEAAFDRIDWVVVAGRHSGVTKQ